MAKTQLSDEQYHYLHHAMNDLFGFESDLKSVISLGDSFLTEQAEEIITEKFDEMRKEFRDMITDNPDKFA